jgi:hypothetical protein
MANPNKGEIAFDVDGKRYTLRYSIDAICSLEAEAGKGMVALIGELQDPSKMSLTLARQVLWAGLLEHHPELTVKEAGELIPAAGGLMKIVSLFNEAFEANFTQAEGKQNPRKAGSRRNGTGPRSSKAGQASGDPAPNSTPALPANST